MGEPVAVAGKPRCKPSVVSIETHRTRFMPRCFSTSNTSGSPLARGISRDSNTSGSSPTGNSTSTTLPCTWVTRPTDFAIYYLQKINYTTKPEVVTTSLHSPQDCEVVTTIY